MKSLKMALAGALVVASSAAFSQVQFVAGETSTGAVRIALYTGTQYLRTAVSPIANVTPGGLIATGQLADTGSWNIVVEGPRNDYYLYSYNSVAQRTGTTRIASVLPGGRGIGAADFDDDENIEFIVAGPDGRIFAYELDWDTGAFSQRISLGYAPLTNLFDKPVGVADCDGDGDPDIVLQNTTTREIAYRYYQGTTRGIVSAPVTDGTSVISPNGVVVGASNGAGNLELHIRAANGAMRVWTMDATGLVRADNKQMPGWNDGRSFVIGNPML